MVETRIPDIPGTLASQEQTGWLLDKVGKLCHLARAQFPGSQPVSFEQSSLALLENEDFWVCEKSDGIRVLVLILLNQVQRTQDVFLIDRKEEFRQITGIKFPNGSKPDTLLDNTILDGELVIDIDPKTGKETLRLYAFDCLVFNGDNLFAKPLSSRYGRLKSWVIEPIRKLAPSPDRPFDIVLKSMELAYGVEKVFHEDIPKLQHGHDGLIFTCCGSGYTVGTDAKILKWKPPSENSIDFKLTLHFPARPAPSPPNLPDLEAMPILKLHQWMGEDEYEFFDTMTVTDEQWEKMKASQIQYDDTIIEVTWSAADDTWSLLRVRDDKPHANHVKTVKSILVSIADGVEAEELFAFSQRIRSAWKQRVEAGRSGPPPPQQQQQQQQQRGPPPPQGGARPQQGGGGGGGGGGGLRR